MPTPKEKHNMNLWRSIQIGCIAGALEAVINHPLYVLKMREQAANKSFKLYHGFVPNMASMIFLTGTRLAASTVIQTIFPAGSPFSQDQVKLLSSFIGGSASSFIGSPIEFIRFTQLQRKASFHQAFLHLKQLGGYRLLFSGLAGTAIRDAIYTTGFFSLAPLFRRKYMSNTEQPKLAPLIISGSLAGIFSGLASHPFDRLKCYQQMHALENLSLRKSASDLIQNKGVQSIFAGSFWRISRVTSGVTIISTTTEILKNTLNPKLDS